MPIGRYEVMDGDGRPVGTEDFRSAPGPAGWRYVSDVITSLPFPHEEVVDLVADASWRPVRTRIQTGQHELLLEARENRLAGRLDGAAIDVPWGPDVELDYASPAYNVLTANRLGRTAEFDVVFLEPVTCQPRQERQRYELLGHEEVAPAAGRFAAQRWRYTALSSGWSRDLWITGDVLVRYEGLYELGWYQPGASGPAPLG
jgi:hypothetical protein